jgi:hypothetical protein
MKKNWYEILYFPTVLILCLIFKISADIGKEKEYRKGYHQGQLDFYKAFNFKNSLEGAKFLTYKRDSLKLPLDIRK